MPSNHRRRRASSRDASLDRLRRLGCDPPAALPILEVVAARGVDEVRARCLALYACVAVAFGLDRHVAKAWIDEAGLREALTAADADFLTAAGGGDAPSYQASIESLWALAWALELIPELDWAQPCADDFVRLFPDPRRGQTDSPVQRAATPRAEEEIAVELDVAYLLHHCDTESRIEGNPSPLAVAPHVIERRRWALEWIVTQVDWDDVTLDT